MNTIVDIPNPFKAIHDYLATTKLPQREYYSLLLHIRPAIVLGQKLYSQQQIAKALRIAPNQLSLYLKFTDTINNYSLSTNALITISSLIDDIIEDTTNGQ